MEEIRAEQRASKGVAMGRAFLVQPPNLAAERVEIEETEQEREKAAFRRATEQARDALRPLARTNPIFAAHLDMAEDDTLILGLGRKDSSASL